MSLEKFIESVHEPAKNITVVVDAGNLTVVLIVGDAAVHIPLRDFHRTVSILGALDSALFTEGLLD